MDAELTALASSGATTLIGLMVTDSWQQVRSRFAALFKHQGADVDEDLERSKLVSFRSSTGELQGTLDTIADVTALLRINVW